MICAHPDCLAEIAATSKTAVCKRHFHSGECRCRQCEGRRAGGEYWGSHDRTVIKTRAQLVAEGLLPEAPLFRLENPA